MKAIKNSLTLCKNLYIFPKPMPNLPHTNNLPPITPTDRIATGRGRPSVCHTVIRVLV